MPKHHPDIIKAIREHKPDSLKLYLSNPVYLDNKSINESLDDEGKTYFHIAAECYLYDGAAYGCDILEILLEHQIDPSLAKNALDSVNINCVDTESEITPLQNAIKQNYPLLFKLLMSHPKIEINKQCGNGWTAVCMAAMYGRKEMLEALIAAEANLFVAYGMKPNPLKMALHVLSEQKVDSPEYQQLVTCIEILHKNYAGIGMDYFGNSIKHLNFSNIILLDAKCDSELMDDAACKTVWQSDWRPVKNGNLLFDYNLSLKDAVRDREVLQKRFSEGGITLNELKKIKSAYLAIIIDAKANDAELCQQARKTLAFLDDTWPDLKLMPVSYVVNQILLAPPNTTSNQSGTSPNQIQDPSLSDTKAKKPKEGGCNIS